ncbi:MFS transporter [Nocardioides flavescens]|uniref:MFS transporter n=1 Tax=Nocardioides flavescens TaxID=2691959 RepID=A0A6L7EWC6_9ACTN|nr:MFS transporter [Nocardioides flavescens]MXG90096.1 MFS transporter [Nocardioides flavescens]
MSSATFDESTGTVRDSSDHPVDLPSGAGRAAAGIAIVLVAQLMLILDATVVNVALPHIDADLGFGPASLSWVLNAYTLAFGGLLLLGGRLGDVFGRRRLFEAGLAVFTVASLVGGLATSPDMLVASRALQGAGAALAAPGVLALLTTSAPDEPARLRALALFGAVTSGGMSIGLLLGGAVTDLGSWRWTLFINVPIGLAVLALTRRFLDETPRRPGRFDLVGAVTATGGAVALVWTLIGAPEHGWSSVRTVLGFVVAALLLAALVSTERRVEHPMVRPALLRNRRRVGALAVIGLVVAGQLSMFFLVVQYVEGQLGFGPMTSGLAFLPLTLGIFTMSRVTPQLLGRVGALPMIVTGTTGLAASFAWLSTLGAGDGYLSGLLGPMLLNGVSAGLVFMPVTSTVLGGVEPEHAGAASGLLQTFQQLGGAVGLAVIVSVFAAHTGSGASTSFLDGAHAAFLASATLAALALVATLLTFVSRRRPLGG